MEAPIYLDLSLNSFIESSSRVQLDFIQFEQHNDGSYFESKLSLKNVPSQWLKAQIRHSCLLNDK